MDRNKFPCLAKAILEAPTIQIPRIDGKGMYEFKAYPFGEAGTILKPKLIKEIRKGLLESAKNFPDFDSIIGIDHEGSIWGGMLAYDLKKPSTEFFPIENYKSPLIGIVSLLIACDLNKPLVLFPPRFPLVKSYRNSLPEDLRNNRKYGFVRVTSPYDIRWLGYNRDALKAYERILLFDDTISEGGTVESCLKVLKELERKVVGVQVILAKSEKYKEIEKKWSVPIRYLAKEDGNKIQFSV